MSHLEREKPGVFWILADAFVLANKLQNLLQAIFPESYVKTWYYVEVDDKTKSARTYIQVMPGGNRSWSDKSHKILGQETLLCQIR